MSSYQPECGTPEHGEEIITCWCGARGICEELFDDACLDEGCGGTGSLNCYCGGDQCVCHNHGEVECPGCDECDSGHGDDWDYDSDYGPEDATP